MEINDQINLIEQIYKNHILFEENNLQQNYKIELCEDYDDLNLYVCKKQLNDKINKYNFIKQLSKIEIRNSLFDSYFEINKLKDIDNNCWVEKLIYNKKNYNIQKFIINSTSILCYSDLNLDDDSFDFMWINNPFTKVEIDQDNVITLKIAFEFNNQYQKDILENFLQCLNKLELALSS